MLLVERYLVHARARSSYRTTSFAPALHHPLPALSHVSMRHKVRPSQSGSMKMAAIVSNVGQSQSGASASFLDRNVSSLGPPPLSHTASNAMRTHPTTTRTTAPYGRSVAGVSPLTMRTTTVLPHTMAAS
jgi:hypothetical protein